jgi:hypothetical protein
MTMEPMDCPAPEHGLMPFLAAGTLNDAERAAAAAHARGCATCTAELQEVRALLDGLRATHLTADEIVDAAGSGAAIAHLDVCPSCRAERDALREVNAALARQGPRFTAWRRPELAWAAALVLSLPAGLYVAGALRREPAVDPEVTRGPAPTARVVVPQTFELARDRATALPPATVVIEFGLPERPAGQHIEGELVDGRGVTLWAGRLPENAERGRLVLDAQGLEGGATLEVRRVDAAGVEHERLEYAMTTAPGR